MVAGAPWANTNRRTRTWRASRGAGWRSNKPKAMRSRKSWRLDSTSEGGEPWPSGPAGGKRGVICTDPLRGNVGGNAEFHEHVHETTVDNRTGEGAPAAGVHVAASSDRQGLDDRGVSADAKGRSSRHRWGESYGQIWCMANSSGGDRLFRFTLFDFNPVPELHTLNDFGQVVKAA